jgi:hypothetical protein
MFSKSIKSTNKKKTKLNWWDYWIGHCWMTGWQSIGINFRIWSDLMTSNYTNYALLKDDDPESECIEWFWVTLNEDDVYPKEFLEYLLELCDKIDRGEEKLIPFTEGMFGELEDLVGDLKNEN